MAVISNLYFKKETLELILKTLDTKKEKGVALTVVCNDESNQWGQNVSAYVSQTKEQKDNKDKKFYVANGSVVWTDGKVTVAPKRGEVSSQESVSQDNPDDLPF